MQSSFARSLLWQDEAIPQDVTSHTPKSPLRRFNVYRNNVFSSLCEAVKARYPVIERLVGEEFFRGMARIFVEKFPPRSPALFEYGGEFAAFLEAFEPVQGLPYLADVARLEWLRQVAYHAADRDPIGVKELGTVPAERIADMVLELHPSAGLISSPYPVVSIWETNTYDIEVRPIGVDFPGEDALVLRPALEVLILSLRPGDHAFISAIAGGAPLGQATAAGRETSAQFSFEQAIAALIRTGAFSGFRLLNS